MITEFDTQLRREAMQWLTVRTHDGAASISSADLLDFEIGGRQFRLMDAQRGIRKPRELSAALSIRTVFTPNGQTRPYDDSVGSDGLLRYKWRGENPDQVENRALRAAMENRLPLIWFFGVGPGYTSRFIRSTCCGKSQIITSSSSTPMWRGAWYRPVVPSKSDSVGTSCVRPGNGSTSRCSVRRCSERMTRAAQCALSGTESYSTQLTSSPTMTTQESRQFVTGCRSARSITQHTTATSWASDPIPRVTA